MNYYPHAYYCEDEEGAQIIFANNPDHAAKRSYDGYADKIKRCPEYDEWWWLGFVPDRVLIDDGWYGQCYYCEKRIDSDEPLQIVEQNYRLFCSPDCLKAHNEESKIRRIRRQQIKCVLRSMFPGVRGLHVWGEAAWFKFPGGKYDVNWNTKSPDTVLLTQLDLPAWEKYREGLQP